MKKEDYAFYIILIIGAILRFYNYDEWSLTNDELSALMRTQFDSFSLLLSEGVKMDGHPAATHIFEYFWIKVFGDSASSLRFPFVVFGTLCIYYAYKTACVWIGSFAALFVAAFIAISELFILYSQIARPYAMGCFLVLFFSYYWSLYLKGNTKIKVSVGFILSGALAILTHYFATLTIFLLLISGFVIISKYKLKNYLLHILIMALICLPHLSITLFQISVGGVGGWLPAPEADFILKYLDFSSNRFFPHQIFYLLIPIVSFFWSSTKLNLKFSIVVLLIFLLSYLIGYFYSLYGNPVLQFSVLIFSTPFLAFFIFSVASFKLQKKLGMLLLALFVISGLYPLIFTNDFYINKKFSNYEGIAEKLQIYNDSLSAENTVIILNSNSHKYFEYYFEQKTVPPLSIDIKSIQGIDDIAKAKKLIDTTDKEFVVVAWANNFMPYEIHEIIKQKFPKRIVHHHYFNSEISVYSKEHIERAKSFHRIHTLDKTIDSWEVNMDNRDSSIYFSSDYSLKIDENSEYAMTYRTTIKELFSNKDYFITISAQLYMPQPTDAKVVVSVQREDESIEWRGYDLKPFYEKGKWHNVVFVFEKTNNLKADDKIVIYIWNPSKNTFWIDDFSLNVFKDSNYDYYDRYK